MICPQDYYFLWEVKDDPECDWECPHCGSGWTEKEVEQEMKRLFTWWELTNLPKKMSD